MAGNGKWSEFEVGRGHKPELFHPCPRRLWSAVVPSQWGYNCTPILRHVTDFSSVLMVHLLMKPVEMGFYSTNLRHLLALRITIALIIGKRIVIKDQLKIILLLHQVVLIRYSFLVWGEFTCNFKCFALEQNASKARTTDAQRGNSLHCTAENSIPIPNF